MSALQDSMIQHEKSDTIAPPSDDEDVQSYKPASDVDPNLQYRSLNRAAVASVAMFVLGLAALLIPVLLILPIAGLLLGYSGYRSIKRYPDEYTGLNLARLGMALCSLLFVGAIAFQVVVYATELPSPDHIRVSFSELQPDENSGMLISKRAVDLRGKKVFIKGYMHPGVAGMGKVDQFVLVPDMGTCCFGGQPKMTDMIMVHTTPEARAAYAPRQLKVGGEFGIGDYAQNFGEVKNVVYRLEADHTR